jgi:hypothetical protein
VLAAIKPRMNATSSTVTTRPRYFHALSTITAV